MRPSDCTYSCTVHSVARTVVWTAAGRIQVGATPGMRRAGARVYPGSMCVFDGVGRATHLTCDEPLVFPTHVPTSLLYCTAHEATSTSGGGARDAAPAPGAEQDRSTLVQQRESRPQPQRKGASILCATSGRKHEHDRGPPAGLGSRHQQCTEQGGPLAVLWQGQQSRP